MQANFSLTRTSPIHKAGTKIAKLTNILKNKSLRKYLKKRATQTLREFKTFQDSSFKKQKTISFLQNLPKQDFQCSICLDIFVFPFKLDCGHIFCFMCLDDLSRCSRKGNQCPCCRAMIGQQYPSYYKIWQHLQTFVAEKLTNDQKDFFMRRRAQVHRQLELRVSGLKNLKVNQKIDCRVGNTWHVGRVIKIGEPDSKISIEVVSDFAQNIYDFTKTSSHLASLGTFTGHRNKKQQNQVSNIMRSEIRDISVLSQPVDQIIPSSAMMNFTSSSAILQNRQVEL